MVFWMSKRRRVKPFADCVGCEKGKSFLIIGAGGSLREYSDPIKKFIEKENAVTIGINKMTGFHIPDYHLWTNKQRWHDFGDCISSDSRLIFGAGLNTKLINRHYQGEYIQVDYTDSPERTAKQSGVGYDDGVIYGNFRTAGCLAVVISHLFGAENIYIVGMDGYTLHDQKEVLDGLLNQHVYGNGSTDGATWEQCIYKDEQVDQALHEIKEYGVAFKILTPTKFTDFYDGTILSDMKQG